jgi:hypothetical protein
VSRLLVALLFAVAAVASAVAWAQGPRAAGRGLSLPHASDDLDCAACHKSSHVSVLAMYAGTGGLGAPASPARMFEVRVQCLACHTAPVNIDRASAALGQTYRANDAACATCHGARYDGLIDRWRTSFAAMRETVGSKLRTARAALTATTGHAGHSRARALVDEGDFNLRLVSIANGAHNPFYAANLLRHANRRLDEAVALVGKPVAKGDDGLVSGGYCATLCHEPAGIKIPATATFGGRPFPHGRHVAELGVSCTTCHSADAHKTLTVTPAACSGCHHRAGSEQCEGCHRQQTAFYRGTVSTGLAKIVPNVMAEAVACTGCHDFSHAPSRAALATACTACHERTYLPLLTEWTTGFGRDLTQTSDAVRAGEAAVAQARQAGRSTANAQALLKEAREALGLVRAGGVAHNPLAADELLRGARERAERARADASSR